MRGFDNAGLRRGYSTHGWRRRPSTQTWQLRVPSLDERLALCATPALHLLFPGVGLIHALILLRVGEFDRHSLGRVSRALPEEVLLHPVVEVSSAADVVAAIGAAKDVHVGHADSVPGGVSGQPLAGRIGAELPRPRVGEVSITAGSAAPTQPTEGSGGLRCGYSTRKKSRCSRLVYPSFTFRDNRG